MFKKIIAMSLLSIIVLVTLPSEYAFADSNPATDNMTSSCSAIGEYSNNTQGSLNGVHVGEKINLKNTTHFDAGSIYQDVLRRPDNSLYFATYIELTTIPSSANITYDIASLKLLIDGTNTPIISGTQPTPTDFVYDTVVNGANTSYKLYFPGNAAALLSDPDGSGQISYTVGAGGSNFELSIDATVLDIPANQNGTSFIVGKCAAGASTGSGSKSLPENSVSVGIVEPLGSINKTASDVIAAPGGFITYTLNIPFTDVGSDGFNHSDAYQVQVVDTLPNELTPIDNSDALVLDGGNVPGTLGSQPIGVYDAGAHTITYNIAEIDAGTNFTITYRAQVEPTLNPLALTALTNNVIASAKSGPATSAIVRNYDLGTSTSTVVAGASVPSLVKTAGLDIAAANQNFQYTASIVIPSGGELNNVTYSDKLDDGLTFVSIDSVTCSGCLGSDNIPGSNLAPYNSPSGWSRFGVYFGKMLANPTDRVITITYSAHINNSGVYYNHSPIPLGQHINNTGKIGYNISDRLGNVLPNMALPPSFDATDTSSDEVEYNRPILTISNTNNRAPSFAPTPSDKQVRYSVTITNSGGVDATNVDVTNFTKNYLLYTDSSIANVTGGNGASFSYDSYNPHFNIPFIAAGTSVTFEFSMELTGTVMVDSFTDISQTSAIDLDSRVTSFYDAGSNYYQDPDPYGSNGWNISDVTTFKVLLPEITITKTRVSQSPFAIDGGLITWKISLVNTGDGYGEINQLIDTLPNGFTFGSVISPSGIASNSYGGTSYGFYSTTSSYIEVAPNSTVDIIYTTNAASASVGTHTNNVQAFWYDGAGRNGAYNSDYSEYRDLFRANASANIVLERPTLSINKTPNESDNAYVLENTNTQFQITLTNTSNVVASNISIDDVMPSYLTYVSNSYTIAPVDASVTLNVDSSLPSEPKFSINHLNPGATIILTMTVNEAGAPPVAEQDFINTATAYTPSTLTSVSDTGQITYIPNITNPSATKSASPSFGAPGTSVTYSEQFTSPTNSTDLYDLTFLDVIPDGIDFVSYNSITCVSGPCLTLPTSLTQLDNADGSTTIGWYLGDQAAFATPSVYEVTYNAIVANTFDGTGTPTAGTEVQDGLAEPFVNRVRPFYNLSDVLVASPGTVPSNTASIWANRGANVTASFDVRTPALTPIKTITNQTQYTWTSGPVLTGKGYAFNPGDRIDYQVEIKNTGSAPAFDATINDDMANGELTNVVIDSIPTGAVVTDGWSIADPDFSLQLANAIPSGSSVFITYHGFAKASSDLLHQMSSYNQDVSLIRNSVSVPQFHSVGIGQPGDRTYNSTTVKRVDAYVYTPAISLHAACYQINNINETATASFGFSNYLNVGSPSRDVHTPGLPNDETKGEATISDLEIRLPNTVSYVPNTMNVDGYAYSATPGTLLSIADPLITLNADGTTTLTIDVATLNKVKLHYGNYGALFNFQVRAKVNNVYSAGGISVGILDTSGSPTRGTNIGDPYTYSKSGDYGCGGGYGLEKRPEPAIDINQYKFFPGETGKYWGSFYISGPKEELTNVKFVDTMPLGVTYVAGSASFNIDGGAIVSAASISETIIVLPSGQQEITWENIPVGDGAKNIYFEIPVVIDSGTTYINQFLTNSIVAFSDQELISGCTVGSCSLSDTGQLFVEDPAQPTMDKTPSATTFTWGDNVDWTVNIHIPKNKTYEDLIIHDVLEDTFVLPLDLRQYAESATYLTQSCVSGCSAPGDALSPTPMPVITSAAPTPRTTELAWYFGDVASASVDRELVFTYRVKLRSLDDVSSINSLNTNNLPFQNVNVNNVLRFYEYKGANGPLPIYDDTSQDWRNQIIVNNANSTLGQPISQVVKPISINIPMLDIAKTCETSNGPGIKNAVSVQPAPSGSVNVVCTITVKNNSVAPAYNITVRDTPSTIGDSYFHNAHTVDWQVLHTNGSQFAPTTTWAGSGNVYVEWQSDPYDALAPGETWTFIIGAHADGFDEWPDAILNPWENPNDNFGIGENKAQLEPWTGSPSGTALITAGKETKPVKLNFYNSTIYVGKKAEGRTLLEDPKDWFQNNAMWQAEPQAYFGNSAYLNEPSKFFVDIFVKNIAGYDVITVNDTLPYGFSYVPNSANIISAVHPDGSPNENSILTNHTIANPGITLSSLTSCPGGTWDNNDPEASDSNEGGDSLNWTFIKTGLAPSNLLWDKTNSLIDSGATGFNSNDKPYDFVYRMAYDAIPTQAAQDCVTEEAAVDRFENNVDISAHLITTGETDISHWSDGVMLFDFLNIEKTPENGFSPDDSNSGFDVQVQWNYPQQNGSGVWDINEMGGAAKRAVITDTFLDRGLYVPGSSTVELISPDGTPYPFTMTETSTRIDADHIQITYELPYIPGGVQDQNVCSAENPFCLIPTTAHIHVPFFVPLDTIDGTQYLNTASVHVYDTEIDINGGSKTQTHTDWVDGPADAMITVINPSAPPTPIKTATPQASVGDIIDYEVKVVLPPNRVWYDLGYSDTLPSNVALVAMGTSSCKYDDGTNCLANANNLSPVISGGITTLGWFFDDLGGESKTRTVTLPFQVRLLSGNVGDVVVNNVLGYSNETNKLIGTPIALPNANSFDYASPIGSASTLIVGPNLTIDKITSTPGPLAPGATASYQVTITNTGMKTAYEFLVIDRPNQALENVNPTGANAIYATKGWTNASPDVRWFVPELAPGNSITFEYSGSITNDYASLGLAYAENVASIDSYYSQPESNPIKARFGPVSDDVQIPLSGPRLELEHYSSACTGTLETQQAQYGQESPWCARLTNAGDNDAVNVQLRLLLPPHFTYVPSSALINGLGVEPNVVTTLGNSQLLTWNLGTVTPGQIFLVDYSAIPGIDASANSKSIATAVSTRADGSAVPFSSIGYVETDDAYATLAFSGLEISKNPPFQELGFLPNPGNASWTITVNNPGGAPTRNISVTDSLPLPLTYIPNSFTSTCAGISENSISTTLTRTNITWSIDDLAPGASCDISITGNHPGGTSALADIFNDAQAVADFVTPVADQARAYIYAPASLAGVAWNDDDRDGIRDTSETFRSGITVTLIDRHGNVVGTAITDSNGNYSFTNLVPQKYTLRFSTIPLGRVVTFKDSGSDDALDSDVDQTTLLTDAVDLQSGENRTGIDIGLGIPQVDLSIAKTLLTDGEKNIGDIIEWRLEVTNNGPVSAVAPLTITDALQSNLEYAGSTPDAGLSCSAVSNTLTCTAASDLAVGQKIGVIVKTKIIASGTISNRGKVASLSQLELDYTNNESEAVFVLGENKTIGIAKSLPMTGSSSFDYLRLALVLTLTGFILTRKKKQEEKILA